MNACGKSGFTLVELMITVLIIAIIMTIAMPSLNNISTDIRLESVRRQLLLDLAYARNETFHQGGQVVICPSDSIDSDLVSCSSTLTDWSDGWIIFEDVDNSGLFNPSFDRTSTSPRGDLDDVLLKTHLINSNADITWAGSTAITFDGEGHATSADDFTICDSLGNNTVAKGVSVNLSGRSRANDSVTCP